MTQKQLFSLLLKFLGIVQFLSAIESLFRFFLMFYVYPDTFRIIERYFYSDLIKAVFYLALGIILFFSANKITQLVNHEDEGKLDKQNLTYIIVVYQAIGMIIVPVANLATILLQRIIIGEPLNASTESFSIYLHIILLITGLIVLYFAISITNFLNRLIFRKEKS